MTKILKLIALALLPISILSGCAGSAEKIKPDSTSAVKAANEFEQGCADFKAETLTHKYLENYRLVLEDICETFEMDYQLVEVISSPKVDSEAVNYYLDANVFGLTYWNRYVKEGMTKRFLILMMEEEKPWWKAELSEYLKIEPVWFGPSAEAGHCYAADPEAFCPKLYVGNEGDTKGNYDVLATMLGSRMEWTTFRKVVPIHESTHGFQTATKLGHWRWWFIEGQATFFELAASVLVPNLRHYNWRDEQIGQSHRLDESRFYADTSAATYQHFKECERNANCRGLEYIGGAFAHELLVNNFGMEKYLNWNLDLADKLPDFNWKEMEKRPQDMEKGKLQFARLFEEHFGQDIDDWERDVLAPYVLSNY